MLPARRPAVLVTLIGLNWRRRRTKKQLDPSLYRQCMQARTALHAERFNVLQHLTIILIAASATHKNLNTRKNLRVGSQISMHVSMSTINKATIYDTAVYRTGMGAKKPSHRYLATTTLLYRPNQKPTLNLKPTQNRTTFLKKTKTSTVATRAQGKNKKKQNKTNTVAIPANIRIF